MEALSKTVDKWKRGEREIIVQVISIHMMYCLVLKECN